MALNEEGDSTLLFECVDDTRLLPMPVMLPIALMFSSILYFFADVHPGIALSIGFGSIVLAYFEPMSKHKRTTRLYSRYLEVSQEGPVIGEPIRTWTGEEILPQSIVCRSSKTLKNCTVSFRTHGGGRWRVHLQIQGVAEGQRFAKLLRSVSSAQVTL